MSNQWNLDLPTESTIYIPYEESDDSHYKKDVDWFTSPNSTERDLQDGPQVRLAAYRKAWESCLSRMNEILHELHVAVITKVVHAVENAYCEQRPLMPYTELPVIAIAGTDRSTMSIVFIDVFEQLNEGSEESDHQDDIDDEDNIAADKEPKVAYIVSLSPADCLNPQQTMKALITGFIDQSAARLSSNSKPSASLANYDMNMLHAWFNTIRMARGEDNLPRLVVLLEEFEQWEASLVENLFYICSLHIPRLPLVFMLAVTSPPLPSYIHTTYPKSTLALLEVEIFATPGGVKVLDELLLKTFFDTSYTPEVLIGPAVLDFIAEQSTLHSFSIDFIFSVLQLLHMRHFMEPLTALVVDDLLSTYTQQESLVKLHESSALSFLNSLIQRLSHSNKRDEIDGDENVMNEPKSVVNDAQSALSTLSTVRDHTRRYAKRSSLGFKVFRLVQSFLLRQGYKTVDSGQTYFGMMSACLRGTLGRKEGKYLTTMIKKLSAKEINELLMELHNFFNDQSASSRNLEEYIRLKISNAILQLSDSNQQEIDSADVAKNVGEWLYEFFVECIRSYDSTDLWDLWYIGQASMLSELVNPSPRTALKEGLLHPERYLPQHNSTLEHVPDLTITFQRYLESGKMINVYDWYESFAVTLNGRKQTQTQENQMDLDNTEPTREGHWRKAKGKAKVILQGKNGPDGTAKIVENDEDWKREILARFIRCVHELDYMGFMKHTNRKADHVIKSFFDPPDYDEE